MRSKSYTIRYWEQTMCGEPGWSYDVSVDGRQVFEGWSRGRKKHAIDDVRAGILARETLIAATREAA